MVQTRLLAAVFLVLILGGIVVHGDDGWQPTEGWYTLHHDVMRMGRTQDSPGVPFGYVWHKEY